MLRTRCCSHLRRPSSTSQASRQRERSDVFHGDPRLRRFSTRLMQDSRGVPNEEIAAMLGPGTVEAFRFAEHVLRGRRRRTTDEPAFCHSADIAIRAADLGYGERVLKACLLHDVVEDGAAHLVEMALFLQQMNEQFGEEVGRDVRVLTNRYAKILEERPIRERLGAPLPFDESGRQALATAIRDYRQGLPESLQRNFGYEFHQVLEWLIPTLDLEMGRARARVDDRHTLLSELQLQSYRLFTVEMADDSRSRPGGFCEVPLVVKAMDLVDNLRTAEVVTWRSLDRILLKVEMFLDSTFFLMAWIREQGIPNRTFPLLYDFLKHQLVEQMEERARALEFLADTRFALLAEFLRRQIRRLHRKYHVGPKPVRTLGRLRRAIRDLNDREQGRYAPALLGQAGLRPLR